ncbi:MAG: BamA/TamA family outer membrane protein [Bacteroidetes bacterium]|nr:BamA/TamA family outer membrane protein [Bacteroidota bacterium]
MIRALVFAFLLPLSADVGSGQTSEFRVLSEQGYEPWPLVGPFPEPSNHLWNSGLMNHFHNLGFFEAHVDSVNWSNKIVFVSKGDAQSIIQSSIVVEGGPFVYDPEGLSGVRALSVQSLEQLFADVLLEASSKGYLSAQIEVREFKKRADGWEVVLELQTGRPYVIEAVILEGDSRTQSTYSAKLAGIRTGEPASGISLSRIRSAILSAGLHLEIGTPRFDLVSDSSAVLVVPAIPRPAGSFDLSAGILPKSAPGQGAGLPSRSKSGSQFIGSGHITLLNAFGRGRFFSVQVDRLPNQSSGVIVAAREPSLRNWPVSVGARFEGFQQDSTFSTNDFEIGLGLELPSNLVVEVQLHRERAKPLGAGQTWIDGQQRISSSEGTFFGVETRLSALDNPASPRRGYYFIAKVESGIKSKRNRRVVGQDSVLVKTSERQERVTMEVRKYWTFRNRWSLLVGLDGRFTFADFLDESELVRLGGARSLRGYNENQFRGRSAARTFTELRLYSDDRTYGFAFYDLGLLETRAALSTKSTTTTYPGFGVGFAFDSAMGPILISYALNTKESFRDGRIHLGLSFGL